MFQKNIVLEVVESIKKCNCSGCRTKILREYIKKRSIEDFMEDLKNPDAMDPELYDIFLVRYNTLYSEYLKTTSNT